MKKIMFLPTNAYCIGRIWMMLKFSLNAICQDGNATLMMLNVEKRYQQRFFIGSLLYLDCKDSLYHQKQLVL